MSATGEPALAARGITKSYGHVQALRGADFECRSGEVTALIGDNGAGKSTLVKVLSGSATPDGGSIVVDGAEYQPTSPGAAHAAGIETVYQDLALAPDLGPTANLFLGRERRRSGVLGRLGFLDERGMREEAAEQFRRLGVTARADGATVRGLSGGQRQGVAVARAVAWGRRIVLLDEPTAALGVVQTRNVLDLVRRVADTGVAVVLISHSMPDVLAVSDRIEVLRLGQRVARFGRGEATIDGLVAAMTGGGAAPLGTGTKEAVS
ncbi:ATP-binding cassette domain-containing protein [Patulibacter defluvii]|uniref:ATP-binding cassette domain-containing protein n=1 Tax=Patulibacter defluvii TaxID=3095358 RepID=UPI002A749FAB|nr:ATP-binding cassette domain-containing protein [Patulibacter sp. DM4]